jgi:hypothetical protein
MSIVVASDDKKNVIVDGKKYDFVFYDQKNNEGFFLMERMPEHVLINEYGIAMCEDTQTGPCIMFWYHKNIESGKETVGIVRSIYDQQEEK